MVRALTSIVVCNCRQSVQLNLSTQGINDPQHVLKSHGRLACLKVNDEAHTNPCRKRQLGLRQFELFASGTQCTAELLR